MSRDLLRLVVWYPVRWALLLLPMRAGLWIMRRMGDLHYAFSRGRREHVRRCLDGLGLGLSGAERERRAVDFVRTHYVNQLVVFLFPGLTRANLGELIEFEGLERLEALREQGRGAVLAHGHMGPAQAPLCALGLLGFSVKQVGFPTDEGLSWIGRNVSFRLRLRYERKIPAEIVKPGAGLRKVLRFLKEDAGLVMAAGDGDGRGGRFGRYGEFVFFGRRTRFPLGPARMAGKTGAALLPLFLVPGDTAPYKAIVGAPISLEAGEEAATAAFLAAFERQVAAHPGWWRFLDRFGPNGFLDHGG